MEGCCGGGCGCGVHENEEEHFFAMARSASAASTCVKTHTGAVVVKNGELVSSLANLCSPEGNRYGEAVAKCPREGMKTGTGYELCKPVHAEVMACLALKVRCAHDGPTQELLEKFAGHLKPDEDEVRAAFTPEELAKLNGATLYLAGHYWACENCVSFLKAVGITDIRLDPTTAKETQDRYQAKGITADTPPTGDHVGLPGIGPGGHAGEPPDDVPLGSD